MRSNLGIGEIRTSIPWRCSVSDLGYPGWAIYTPSEFEGSLFWWGYGLLPSDFLSHRDFVLRLCDIALP